MNPSAESDGRSESGIVPRAVSHTIAPERLATSLGSPHAVKMDENESPITIVYCRLTESVSTPIRAEGTQAEDSPTDLDHASPQDLEPVAAHTLATIEKQYPETAPAMDISTIAGTIATRELLKAATPTGNESTPEPTMDLTRLAVEAGRPAWPSSSAAAAATNEIVRFSAGRALESRVSLPCKVAGWN